MGVQGLWSILYSTGRDIDLSSLEGKVLAIDLSIWLHQALKSGIDSPNAHLEILFRRICKLLYFNIKPIFVFDGPYPTLKKENISARRKQRQMKLDKSAQIKSNIINLLMKKKLTEKRQSKVKTVNKAKENEDIFKLPENDYFDMLVQRNSEIDLGFSDIAQDYLTNFTSTNDINLESESFQSMPLEVQHEVIRNVAKEKRYGYSRNKDNLLEKVSAQDFSSIQIRRLLNRNSLQQKVEDLRTSMNYRNNQNVINSFTCHQMKSLIPSNVNTRKVMSHQSGYLMMIDPSESDLVDSLTKLKRKYIFQKSEQSKGVTEAIFHHESSHLPLSDSEKCDNQPQSVSQSEVERNSSEGSLLTTLNDKDLSLLDKTIQFEEHQSEDDTETEDIAKNAETFNSMGRVEGPLFSQSSDKNDFGDFSLAETHLSYDVITSSPITIENIDPVYEPDDKIFDLMKSDLKSQFCEPKNISIISVAKTSNQSTFCESKPIFKNSDVSSTSPERNNNDDESNSDDSDFVEVPELVEKKDADSSGSICDFSPAEIERILADPVKWQEDIDEEISRLYEEEHLIENQAINMSERYYQEAKELLKLFGIPYVDSPGEAEAQCAFLEKAKFSEGTITEDSDIWLFGGSMVYKHFFSRDCSVRAYDLNFIYKKLGLTRDLMICIALLSGSDYAQGVYGVGPVIAMEILAEFSDPQVKQNNFEVLQNFKHWHDQYSGIETSQPYRGSPNKKRFLRFNLDSNFPDSRIFDAYNIPLVDESKEPFIWTKPSIEKLLEFAQSKIGWSNLKVLEMLNLSLDKKRKRPQMCQKSILQYFTNSEVDELLNSKKSPSKRLKLAVKQRNFLVKDNVK